VKESCERQLETAAGGGCLEKDMPFVKQIRIDQTFDWGEGIHNLLKGEVREEALRGAIPGDKLGN